MAEEYDRYWFSKSRWAWGRPSRWQGWVFVIVWFAAFLLTPPFNYLAGDAFFQFAMIVVALAVFYSKSPPFGWGR